MNNEDLKSIISFLGKDCNATYQAPGMNRRAALTFSLSREPHESDSDIAAQLLLVGDIMFRHGFLERDHTEFPPKKMFNVASQQTSHVITFYPIPGASGGEETLAALQELANRLSDVTEEMAEDDIDKDYSPLDIIAQYRRAFEIPDARSHRAQLFEKKPAQMNPRAKKRVNIRRDDNQKFPPSFSIN